jgi:hypothetical protein
MPPLTATLLKSLSDAVGRSPIGSVTFLSVASAAAQSLMLTATCHGLEQTMKLSNFHTVVIGEAGSGKSPVHDKSAASPLTLFSLLLESSTTVEIKRDDADTKSGKRRKDVVPPTLQDIQHVNCKYLVSSILRVSLVAQQLFVCRICLLTSPCCNRYARSPTGTHGCEGGLALCSQWDTRIRSWAPAVRHKPGGI